MNRVLAIGVLILVLITSIVWIKREPLQLRLVASQTETRSIGEQEALISSFIQFIPPDNGEGPFPTVVQFHGCDGFREDYMGLWAKAANEAGYMAVTVDSTGARGIDNDTSLEIVCKGQTLIGQERVADIVAAMNIVRADARADKNRVVLAGWSHGAWTLMDSIAMQSAGKKPPTLSDAKLIDHDVGGYILFYPYCGPGAWSRFARWRNAPSTIAFIAGKDTIVDTEQCRTLFEKLKSAGADIDVHYYPDADHVFDDSTPRNVDTYYNEEAATDARAKYIDFLHKKAQ